MTKRDFSLVYGISSDYSGGLGFFRFTLTVPFLLILQLLLVTELWIVLFMECPCLYVCLEVPLVQSFMSIRIFNSVFFPYGSLFFVKKLLLYGSFATKITFFTSVCCVLLTKFLISTLIYFNDPADEVSYCYSHLVSTVYYGPYLLIARHKELLILIF